MKHITLGTFEARLLLAFVLGACIGLERQWRHKLAGIKTNSLVAGGAALFILLAEKITGDSTSTARVAAQIVTGIGFLGAGVILREGFNITGLNTSATIWCSGAIGSLAGMGYWYEASVGSGFVIIANIALRPISDRLDRRINKIEASGNQYLLKIKVKDKSINNVRSVMVDIIQRMETLHIGSIKSDTETTLLVMIKSLDRRQSDIEFVVKELSKVDDVEEVSWKDFKTKTEND